MIEWGMSATTDEILAEKLRTAFELLEAGVEMKRASIRRRYPALGSRDVERRVHKWLCERKLPMEGIDGYRLRSHGP